MPVVIAPKAAVVVMMASALSVVIPVSPMLFPVAVRSVLVMIALRASLFLITGRRGFILFREEGQHSRRAARAERAALAGPGPAGIERRIDRPPLPAGGHPGILHGERPRLRWAITPGSGISLAPLLRVPGGQNAARSAGAGISSQAGLAGIPIRLVR